MFECHPTVTGRIQKQLAVGNNHSLYVEEYGNPDGIPVIVIMVDLEVAPIRISLVILIQSNIESFYMINAVVEDTVCHPDFPQMLIDKLTCANSHFLSVTCTDAGHSGTEPANISALVNATNNFAAQCDVQDLAQNPGQYSNTKRSSLQ